MQNTTHSKNPWCIRIVTTSIRAFVKTKTTKKKNKKKTDNNKVDDRYCNHCKEEKLVKATFTDCNELLNKNSVAESTGIVEYIDCKGVDIPDKSSAYGSKLCDGEAPILELWGIVNTHSLPLLPDLPRPGVLVPVSV